MSARARLSFACGAALLLAACHSTFRESPRSIPRHLVSPTSFRLHSLTALGDSLGTVPVVCEVQRAEVEVQAVRGDTLYFSRLVSHRTVGGGASCALSGAGYVHVSAHPDLRAEQAVRSGDRTALAWLLGLPLLGGLVFFFCFILG